MIPGLVALGGALGAAVGVLVVEGVGLVGSLVGVRRFAGWPLGRGALKGLAAAAAGGGRRELSCRRGWAGSWRPSSRTRSPLVVLRPIPASVCLRLVRGALGRPGPPTAAGAG